MAISWCSASKGGYGFILLFTLFMLSSMVAVAEIRNYKIDSEALEFSPAGKLYIDSFNLVEKSGRIQLKVTDIIFPDSSSSNDPSQIGFFLAQNRLSIFSSRCYLQGGDSNVVVLYTLNNLQHNNNSFDLTFSDINKTRDYVLYYQNCVHDLNTTVTMKVQSTMYNLDEDDGHRPLYLSPNKNFLIMTNTLLSLVYFAFDCFWFFYICMLLLKKDKQATVKWIHMLMSFVPNFKALSLLFNVMRHKYILKVGCAQCYTSLLLTFTSNFLYDTPLILMLVIVCAGWSLVKPGLHLLPSKKRSLLLLVIGVVSNELLLNSAGLWLLQVSPFVNEITYMYPGFFDGFRTFGRWCLLLQAVRSATDSLKELGASTYGKASESIKYIQLIREMFSNYLWYCIFQTLVYFLEAFTSYLFLSLLLKELLTLAFYAYVASMLRPENEKDKLLMVNDDAEKDAQKALLEIPTQLWSYLFCLSWGLKWRKKNC